MAQWTQNRSIITGLRTSRWSPDCRAQSTGAGDEVILAVLCTKRVWVIKTKVCSILFHTIARKKEERVVSCGLKCCQTKKAMDNEDSSQYLSHVVSWDTRHERGVRSRWLLSVTRVTGSYLQTPPPDQPVSHLRPALLPVLNPHCL